MHLLRNKIFMLIFQLDFVRTSIEVYILWTFFSLFRSLCVWIAHTFKGIWMWKRCCLSARVGLVFCMHAAVSVCLWVWLCKCVFVCVCVCVCVCCGAGAGVCDTLWPRVSCVGCSEEAYKLKIELLETGGIHNRRTKYIYRVSNSLINYCLMF